jgi:hypothetical protein
MPEPANPADNRSRVVVAYLDGRRLKGYVYNFSPFNVRFRLFPLEEAPQSRGIDVQLKELKAVFIVRDFAGNPGYKESQRVDPSRVGRRIEVILADGEKIIGTTDAYNPQKPGFYVSPADLESNTLRAFVIKKNAKHIRFP